MTGTAYIVKTRGAWMEQVETAQKAWEESDTPTLRAFAGVNYEQFCKLIEAMHALGANVSPAMMQLAKMRPVNELLGI